MGGAIIAGKQGRPKDAQQGGPRWAVGVYWKWQQCEHALFLCLTFTGSVHILSKAFALPTHKLANKANCGLSDELKNSWLRADVKGCQIFLYYFLALEASLPLLASASFSCDCVLFFRIPRSLELKEEPGADHSWF